MPIIIKEIHVNTVVEKRVILPADISESLYQKLKNEIVQELTEQQTQQTTERKKKER